jgi:hypothetical protein
VAIREVKDQVDRRENAAEAKRQVALAAAQGYLVGWRSGC